MIKKKITIFFISAFILTLAHKNYALGAAALNINPTSCNSDTGVKFTWHASGSILNQIYLAWDFCVPTIQGGTLSNGCDSKDARKIGDGDFSVADSDEYAAQCGNQVTQCTGSIDGPNSGIDDGQDVYLTVTYNLVDGGKYYTDTLHSHCEFTTNTACVDVGEPCGMNVTCCGEFLVCDYRQDNTCEVITNVLAGEAGDPCGPDRAPCESGSCVEGVCQGTDPDKDRDTDKKFDPTLWRQDYDGKIVDFETLLQTIYGLLLPIGIGLIAIPLIIINGYKIMTSQGDPSKVMDGKEGLTSAIIGLLFILLSIWIIRIVIANFLQ